MLMVVWESGHSLCFMILCDFNQFVAWKMFQFVTALLLPFMIYFRDVVLTLLPE